MAVEEHVAWIVRERATAKVAFQEVSALSPARRAKIVSDRNSYELMLCALIEEGQGAGVFTRDVSPYMAVMGMLGMMNWIYQWYRPEGGRSAAEIAETFADLILGGIVHQST